MHNYKPLKRMIPGSIVVKEILNLGSGPWLEQRKHQQNSGLLRVELIGCHKIQLIVVHFYVAPNRPRHNAAASDNHYSFLRGIRRSLQGSLIHVSIADASDDDTFRAPSNRCVD